VFQYTYKVELEALLAKKGLHYDFDKKTYGRVAKVGTKDVVVPLTAEVSLSCIIKSN
jgi:hypothetical protein